jgi:hypothetical protein
LAAKGSAGARTTVEQEGGEGGITCRAEEVRQSDARNPSERQRSWLGRAGVGGREPGPRADARHIPGDRRGHWEAVTGNAEALRAPRVSSVDLSRAYGSHGTRRVQRRSVPGGPVASGL